MTTPITEVRDPIWGSLEMDSIGCYVRTVEFGDEWLPYGAIPTDPMEYGRQLYADLVAGVYGPISPYVAPPPYVPDAQENKEQAEVRLAATDWVNQPDVYDPNNPPYLTNRDAFLTYRSQVRTIAVYPTAGILDWPVCPEPIWSEA